MLITVLKLTISPNHWPCVKFSLFRCSCCKDRDGQDDNFCSNLILLERAEPEMAENSHNISYRENQPLPYRLEH